jgi:hypothetical protein
MSGRPRRPVPGNPAPYVGELVLLALAALCTQAIAMGYGGDPLTWPTYWFAGGFALLALVQLRRSSLARALVVVACIGGAIVCLPFAGHPGVSVLMVSFVIEAVALLAPPVSRHVHQSAEQAR